MAYAPKNSQVYFAAFAGAMGGINGANVVDSTAADYVFNAQVADAFAQAFDTAWGVAGANAYELSCITDLLAGYWTARSSSGASTVAASYTAAATALVIAIRAGDTQAAAQGIAPPGAMSVATIQGNIIVDPQNVTGVATATGKNTATVNAFTGPVFDKWASLVAAWGSISPIFNAVTAIVFVSNHTDNTDPVAWAPYLRGNVQVSLQGTNPTVVTSGVVLAGTVAKNRAAGANSLLQTNIGATGTTAQLVENTTHSSRAWVYSNVAGNVWNMTQPLVKSTVGGTFSPAEVDTWANGDTVNLLTPINVNISYLAPVYLDGGLGTTNILNVFQLNVFDPGGTGTNILSISGQIRFFECSFQRNVTALQAAAASTALVNCITLGQTSLIGVVIINGGANMPSSLLFKVCEIAGAQCQMDGDYILGAASATAAGLIGGTLTMGLVFLDTTLTVQAGQVKTATIAYGSHVLYSSAGGQIAMQGNSRIANTSGTFVAGWTGANLVTGITLNGSATGISHTNAQPDVWNGAVTTTAAHLDAAAGATGFGGNAMSTQAGGASIGNAA